MAQNLRDATDRPGMPPRQLPHVGGAARAVAPAGSAEGAPPQVDGVVDAGAGVLGEDAVGDGRRELDPHHRLEVRTAPERPAHVDPLALPAPPRPEPLD